MYTAKLKNRVIEGGIIRWVVEFTDGVDLFIDSFKVNRYADLQTQVARRLAELNFIDTFTIDTPIDTTLPEVTQPTQDDLDRMQWIRDWQILQSANNLILSGVIVDTLPAYVSHKSKVVANFKPSYISFL